MNTSLFTRRNFCSYALSLLCFVAVSVSSAAADVSGLWTCHFNLNGLGDYPQDINMFQVGSSVTGQEFAQGTQSAFANISSGTTDGINFSIRVDYIGQSYFAIIEGAVSGSSMSGNWHNDSQQGGFACSLAGSAVGTPSPTPNPGDKRPTAINLFCNRTGVGLSTADCAVTVGDAGPPPRSAPTGQAKFVSRNGFFPANGACDLQQTPYSTGVVSCKAEFAIPFGFPLGIAFPIDATYDGDSVFAGSSTSHATIQAGCVGDASNPCSGAVALTFADIPQILKDKLAMVFECGKSNANSAVAASASSWPNISIFGDIAKCTGSVIADAKLGDLLAGLDLSQLNALAGSISNKDARSDGLLKAIQALDDSKYQDQLQQAVNNSTSLTNLINKIMQDQAKNTSTIINNLKESPVAAAGRRKRYKTLTFGSADILVKNNSRKAFKIRLNPTAGKLIKALKKAGVGDLNLTISMKGKRTSGPKRPFKKSFGVNVGLS